MVTVASILGGKGIWIIYFDRSTPTLIPSSTSVGESFSLSLTTNLAICLIWITYLFYFPSFMILLHLATWRGCSAASLLSAGRFHCEGNERPVSNSLIPKNNEESTCEFIDFLDHFFILFFKFFDRLSIRPKTIGFKQIDFCLIERDILLFFFVLFHFKYFLKLWFTDSINWVNYHLNYPTGIYSFWILTYLLERWVSLRKNSKKYSRSTMKTEKIEYLQPTYVHSQSI